MILQVVIGLVLVGASQQSRTNGEIKAWFLERAVECSKHHPITPDEMMMMKDHKMPESRNAKCLMACVLRKTNFIDDKGNYDVEKALAWVGKEFEDDPERLENAKNLYDFCKKVNEETVTDGVKGCDRAYHLSKCLAENSAKMGFVVP